MWWKRSKAPVPDNLANKIRQARAVSDRSHPNSIASAENELAEALQRFWQKIDTQMQRSPSPDLEKAQRTLEKARAVVDQSGLGRALAPTLVEEVKYWPSWSKRDDFQKYVHFDATNVRGKHESGQNGKSLTAVEFAFQNRRFQVVIRDDGLPPAPSSTSGQIRLSLLGPSGRTIALHLGGHAGRAAVQQLFGDQPSPA